MANKSTKKEEKGQSASAEVQEMIERFEHRQSEYFKSLCKERMLVQENLFDLYNSGAEYTEVMATLFGLYKGGTRETRIGNAAECLLTQVQMTLFGQFLDDPEE
jgi:hypothetical protein